MYEKHTVFVTATTGLAACSIGGTTVQQFAGILHYILYVYYNFIDFLFILYLCFYMTFLFFSYFYSYFYSCSCPYNFDNL